jgi:glycosyltransferase involved in cell wall biosynthesis
MKARPNRKHVVTVRDPRDLQDWKMEYDLPSLNKFQVIHNYFYENNVLVRNCIKDMNAVFTSGKYLVPKVKSLYNLEIAPAFLPTPVHIPEKVNKSDTPTVCYVARMDRRKRPKLFLDLAKKFPGVHFIAIGKSRDKKWEGDLQAEYSHLANLEMTGFVDQFSSDLHSKILEKSWIMVNTATREALPNSFLEAAAHQCAILSSVDPDGFASLFGYHARNCDFVEGLAFLLENQRWKERGQRGYAHVRDTFELHRAIDLHIATYRRVLA